VTGLQPIRTEVLIGGSWVNVTQGSRTRGSEKVSIRDGSSSESTFLAAGSCDFTLNNRDGLFSPGNVTGTYYGKLGRNIQTRTGLYGTKYLRLFGQYGLPTQFLPGQYDGTAIYTADRAALDITGDIDIRIDIDPRDWHGDRGRQLISKYNTTGDQRSWDMYLIRNGVQIAWSTDGTAGNRKFNTLFTLPFRSGRGALRFTLDVDNGAGGYTATWYTSDTISGTWTQVQQNIVAGTTSIFSSSARLEIGDTHTTGAIDDAYPFVGKVFGAQVRSGIAGTLVANLDPSSRARGDTTWADGLGSTWVSAGSAVVDDMDYRFWGAIAKLPQRWDTTGNDLFVPVSANDILAQISSGSKALDSPYYRLINTRYAGPAVPPATSTYYTGWWPMESGTGSTISAVKGQTGTYSNASFSTWPEMPGTGGALTFSDDTGNASGAPKTVSGYIDAPGTPWLGTGVPGFSAMFLFQLPSLPASNVVIMRWRLTAGSIFTVTLTVTPASGYIVTAYDRTNNPIFSSSVGYGASSPTSPTLIRIALGYFGVGALNMDIGWLPVGSANFFGLSDIWAAPGPATIGRAIGWDSPGFAGKSGMKLGQMLILQGYYLNWGSTSLSRAVSAYVGETPVGRFLRLAGESGIAWQVRGNYVDADLPTMGAQSSRTLFDLLREAVDVLGGTMYAARDFYGLELRTLAGLAGRAAYAPVLDYEQYHLSPQLQPDRVTSTIRNSVTASRSGGGERYSVKRSGSLNINDPSTDPDGAGLWESSITRSVNTDVQLQSQADWERALGTDDSDRYSSITVELHRPEFEISSGVPSALAGQVKALHLGDPVLLANLPFWMGTQDPVIGIRGRQEVLQNFEHSVTWNAAPYGPYQWGGYDATKSRYDSSSTTLAAAMGSSDVYAKFALGTTQTRWSQKAVPYDVIIAGQQNTVTEVGGKGSLGTADFGGFESGVTTGWTGAGGTLTASTAQKKYGTRSGLITVSGSPVTVTLRRSSSTFYVPVVAAASYTLSFWVYSSITITANLAGVIDWYAGASFLSTSTAPAASVVANTWTQLTFTATAPATATLAQYGPTVSGSPANGTLLYFDGVEVAGTDVSFQPVIMTRGVDGITKALPISSSVHVLDQVRWGRQ
jgi:hypothetical protein